MLGFNFAPIYYMYLNLRFEQYNTRTTALRQHLTHFTTLLVLSVSNIMGGGVV